ncbi:MAG: AcrR family transcriptional regulator [Patiriisocius sp.]|jgi:AcrR family transcriptional regulator
MTSTQDCLLDAAEALFVEKGYAATSLRSIATRAKVNLAATHYHFGSKEGLLAAIVHRRVTPINKARLKALDTLEKTGSVNVATILEAFLMPLTTSEEIEHLPGLIGRIHSEPPSVIKPLLEKEFGEVAERFVGALGKALPGLPQEELFWRFHFLIGGMLQTLTLKIPLGLGSSEDTYQEKFQRLIQFANAGFLAPAQSSGEKL